jgi:hypothetical protein
MGKNVDHLRRGAPSKERARIDEIFRLEVCKRRAEFRRRRVDRFRILSVRLHEEIEVFGSSGLRVNGDGVAADDKVFNAVLVERGQEFFEVLTEHRALVPSIGTA